MSYWLGMTAVKLKDAKQPLGPFVSNSDNPSPWQQQHGLQGPGGFLPVLLFREAWAWHPLSQAEPFHSVLFSWLFCFLTFSTMDEDKKGAFKGLATQHNQVRGGGCGGRGTGWGAPLKQASLLVFHPYLL